LTSTDGLELGEALLTIWFLAFLAVLWMIFFLPAGRRARQQTPLPAAERFKRHLKLIAPPRRLPRGRWMIAPPTEESTAAAAMDRGQRRRRRILISLVAAVVLTALIALQQGGNLIEVHLIADAALFFYIALLLEAKRRRLERAAKVRRLEPSHAELRDRHLAAASGRR
jgi:hypothetical protein